MTGFNDGTLYASNVDFTGNAQPSAQIVSDGQLLIGSSVAPNIRAGSLSSTDGSVTITVGPGTINLKANSSGVSVTQHALLIGGSSNSITSVIPGIAGSSPVSNGVSSDPSFLGVAWGVYGDGSDGVQTFDGSSVILGITPSGNSYTLLRDILLADGSAINNGVSIITNGYKIFCFGTLTNNGTIQWNGSAGLNTGVGGTGLQSSQSSFNSGVLSGTGGAGNTGAGSTGTASAQPAYGGMGGSGGTGGSVGGAGGAPIGILAAYGFMRFFPYGLMGFTIDGTGAIRRVAGGTGGGGGGGDGSIVGGGGGGGAGMIICSVMFFAGTGSISAIGGVGGNGGVGGTNCGGGGGGGGGLIIVYSRSSTSVGGISGQTISVAGGLGGVKTGTGANGSPGAIGIKIVLAM